MQTALVHIGTHKTGSTAFQHWIRLHADELRRSRDIAVYASTNGSPNHQDYPLLAMRPNRTFHGRTRTPQWCLDEWQAEARAHIAAQVASDADHLLVSAEGLSLLRHADEVTALAELLQPRRLRVAVCLRDEADFLESYRAQLAHNHESELPYPSSHRYVEPGTWLTQWDDMLRVWRGVLGDDAVTAFGYEGCMAAHGSTIPGVLTALGVDPAGLPSWEGFRRNVTDEPTLPADSSRGKPSVMARVARRIRTSAARRQSSLLLSARDHQA